MHNPGLCLRDVVIAFVFPGQGSQYSGMGRDVAAEFAEAGEVFAQADGALGFSLSRLCFEGSEDELQLTETTQPAVLATSVALFRILERQQILPDFVAGHSLGEYSALVAAGGLDFEDAVRLVHQRGRFMQEAVPVGEGAMAAVLGLKREVVESVCQEAAQGEVVSAANINSADQIVISGHRPAVERAGDLARQAGARKVLSLAVSAPFHCALMRPAQERLAEVIQDVAFHDLKIPLVNNVEARKVTRGEEARQGLVKQVSAAVLWCDCVQQMVRAGVSTFVEVGPGKALRGLIRKIAPSVQTHSIENREQLEAYARLF